MVFCIWLGTPNNVKVVKSIYEHNLHYIFSQELFCDYAA